MSTARASALKRPFQGALASTRALMTAQANLMLTLAHAAAGAQRAAAYGYEGRVQPGEGGV